jgi:DNA-binding response OmpR family regulator
MMKVLVVDDDLDLLEMVCLMLQTPEMVPICIDNGDEVLPTVEHSKPDVLVMDIFLGPCDGRDICKEIKSSKTHPRLPVLLYSAGYITQESIRESGADGFLSKPFDMNTLVNTIENLVKNKQTKN